MGVVKDTSKELKGLISGATSGLLIYGLTSMVAGEYYFATYGGSEIAWGPLYLLFLALVYALLFNK